MLRAGLTFIAVLATSAAFAVAMAAGAQDLRSPDARDAALSAAPVRTVDLRSPDARDVAAGRPSPSSVVVDVVRTPASSAGFDWGDAAVGAAVALGLSLVGAGAARMVARRRDPDLTLR